MNIRNECIHANNRETSSLQAKAGQIPPISIYHILFYIFISLVLALSVVG